MTTPGYAKPLLKPAVEVRWKAPDIVITKRNGGVSLTPREFDEITHWALSAGLLPALAAEVRRLADGGASSLRLPAEVTGVPSSDLPPSAEGAIINR